MDVKELLEKRKALKNKKPEFIRQDAHKKVKVGWKWRKPKGSDSKMRVGFNGYRSSVAKGWKSPTAVRGTIAGLEPVTISNVKDLEKIDAKTQIAIISASVGAKKVIAIIDAATKKTIKIANFKDAAKAATEIKTKFDAKKTAKAEVKKARDTKKEVISKAKEAEAKKAEKKVEDAKKEAPEEKAKSDKKEKDKVLTQSN